MRQPVDTAGEITPFVILSEFGWNPHDAKKL